MKLIVMIGLAASVSAAVLTTTTSADAQQKVRIYKWCLEEARGLMGSGQTLCRFDTLAQCRASINGGGDRCIQNFYNQRP